MRYSNLLHFRAKDLFRSHNLQLHSPAPPMTHWEWVFLAATVLASLALGMANLGVPSLWHDELVHVYVAKNIAATGWPALPSGNFYPSSTAYNYLLALFVALFGDSGFAVRLPSALLGGFNVALAYFLCRHALGRPAALFTALFLATSPWHVAWSRQARLYESQVTSYLLLLHCAWQYFIASNTRNALRYGSGAIAAYTVGILTSFHSIVYLGPVGAFAILIGLRDPQSRRRCAAAVAACTALGLLTILWFYLNPNPVDRAAVFETGLGGNLLDPLRTDRYYYFRFFADNLSTGFLALLFIGSFLLLAGRDRRALWILLGFWAPVLILTFFVGYRRFRFVYFAYPIYVMIGACGLTGILGFARHYRRSVLHGVCTVALLLFVARLALSEAALTRDSVLVASGADYSLATLHPQWKRPAEWVKAHRNGEAVLTTTFLPAYHYIGHVDNWFPNRYTLWEYQESGLTGLGSLEELKAFLAEHPKGYFLAEYSRFEKWRWNDDLVDVLGQEVSWVETHMTRIAEASSEDVYVWHWDFLHDGHVVIP